MKDDIVTSLPCWM